MKKMISLMMIFTLLSCLVPTVVMAHSDSDPIIVIAEEWAYMPDYGCWLNESGATATTLFFDDSGKGTTTNVNGGYIEAVVADNVLKITMNNANIVDNPDNDGGVIYIAYATSTIVLKGNSSISSDFAGINSLGKLTIISDANDSTASLTIGNSSCIPADGIVSSDDIIINNSNVTVYGIDQAVYATNIFVIDGSAEKIDQTAITINNDNKLQDYESLTYIKFTANNQQSSTPSFSGGYTLYKTISSNLQSISKVYVDGKEVESKFYTLWGNNVTLNETFLKTLSAGEHSIKLSNDTSEATGKFTLGASEISTVGVTKENTIESAKTGDISILLYSGLTISSLLGMGYVTKKMEF